MKRPAEKDKRKRNAAARDKYKKICDQAWAEYEKIRAPAWAEYEKIRNQA